MTKGPPGDVLEFVDETLAAPQHTDPSQYVLRWRWYYPAVIGGTVLVFAALYAMADGLVGLLTLSIGGTLAGVTLTLIAMAWSVAIVFADNARRGLWFTLFPPYMVVYTMRRWKWMAQPAVLFLCGITLAAAALWTTQKLAEQIGGPADQFRKVE